MDIDLYFRFSLALAFVIALFVVVALVMRRFGLGGAATSPSRRRRLSVVEVAALDAKRRMVLVRRDEVEHLLLLGPNGDLLVEGSIRTGFGEAIATAQGNIPGRSIPERNTLPGDAAQGSER